MAVTRRRAGFLTALGTIYLVDKHFCYSTVQRNIYTLATAAIITLDIKFNFRPGKADKIDNLHDRVSKRILDCCKNNGGLYIKFGQQIATVPVLPAPYIANLKQLYDQAPVVDYATICKIFKEEFGSSPDEIFKEFDHEPVQSASIAQVHKATLISGEKVAVKIQKPAIKFQIGMDMLCYRFLIFALEKVFELPLYWTADYIELHLRQETDFLNEAENSRRCRENLKSDPHLFDMCYVPTVFSKYSSERIMTAEWIDGISLMELNDVKKSGFSPTQVMTDIINCFSSQIFSSGFVHADPHVGNILLRPHPKHKNKAQIVLLDHGLYVQCNKLFTDQYSRFWVSLLSMDTEGLKKITQMWGIQQHELFASATLSRPWKEGKYMKSNPTLQDIYESQVEAKARIKQFLSETDKLPKELLFVGRNLNCIRANNRNLGSPVNRINLMANYANRCIAIREDSLTKKWWVTLKFHFSLFTIECMHLIALYRQKLYKYLGYGNTGGLESIMDKQLGASFQKAFGGKNGALEINLDALADLMKNSSVVFYDGFLKPFNNVKSTIENGSSKDRIEFFEGFIDYMIDHSHEEAIILPGLQKGEDDWNSKTTKVALGMAYLSKMKKIKAPLGSMKCNLYILEGIERKSEIIVPGLNIVSVCTALDLPIVVSHQKSLMAQSSSLTSISLKTDILGKRKDLIDQSETIEQSAKRPKTSMKKSSSAISFNSEDEGEISEESIPIPSSKIQPPYLIWEKYNPPTPVVYPASSLGAILNASNPVNRPDFFGRQ